MFKQTWLYILITAVVCVSGAAIYHFISTNSVREVSIAQKVPSANSAPDNSLGNPLLTATYENFSRWYPPYCENEIYMVATTKRKRIDFCIEKIIARVRGATGVNLTASDVIDPAVKKHWLEVRGHR